MKEKFYKVLTVKTILKKKKTVSQNGCKLNHYTEILFFLLFCFPLLTGTKVLRHDCCDSKFKPEKIEFERKKKN